MAAIRNTSTIARAALRETSPGGEGLPATAGPRVRRPTATAASPTTRSTRRNRSRRLPDRAELEPNVTDGFRRVPI